METDSSRPRPGSSLLRSALAAMALLLTLAAGSAPRPAPPREILVHGQRLLAPGLPPARGGGAEEGGGSERESLIRWIESRHRAAPGVDWRAIEVRNLQASLAYAAALEKAGGARPVWHERGPVNQTGATAFTTVAPDGKTLLVATSQGGIFSGVPGTSSWRRLTDSLGGYIRGFTVSPRPEVWAAAVSSGLNGGQVYASRNRGTTWSPSRGLPPLYSVYEMIQDGGHPQTVYLLAVSYLDGRNAVPFVARSRDGGLSFSLVYAGADFERPGIWTSRTGSGPLYLMSHGQLLISTDQGSSFSPLGRAASEATNFAVLRGSEAGAPTLYAALGTKLAAETLYASEDGGGTWQSRFQLTGTSYYAFDAVYSGGLAVSRQDPDLVLFGNANAFRSTDGARSFQPINDWSDYYGDPGGKLHADINGIHFVTYRGQETLFLSTDGGTYLSTDGGQTVQNITQLGLPVAQLYSTWSSASNPGLLLAGTQDQGLQLSVPSGGTAALDNAQLISGDYGGLTAASHDMTNVFALYPTVVGAKGFLLLFTLDELGLRIFQTPLPAMSRSGAFAASLADPDDPSTVYVAGDHIWKMTHRGNGDFSQSQLAQNFSADQVDYVSALAIAPADHNVWYAATFEGHLWYSRDHGATWTESDTTRGQLSYSSSGTLAVAAGDPSTCYVGGSGYGSPPVLVTRDGGVTWSGWSNGLPSTVVWGLAFDGSAAQTLYAATEAGPYVFDARARAWRSLLGGGAPAGRYFSVEGLPSLHLMRFGTFSRGIWDYVPSTR